MRALGSVTGSESVTEKLMESASVLMTESGSVMELEWGADFLC
jgi:hypothetical protein